MKLKGEKIYPSPLLEKVMAEKCIGEVDCMMCGYCCGYRRDSHFGGCSYSKEETIPDGVIVIEEEDCFRIPVDEDDTCIYLNKLDNGFAICSIHDKKPNMCKLYYCMLETKIRELDKIKEHLIKRCNERDRAALKQVLEKV